MTHFHTGSIGWVVNPSLVHLPTQRQRTLLLDAAGRLLRPQNFLNIAVSWEAALQLVLGRGFTVVHAYSGVYARTTARLNGDVWAMPVPSVVQAPVPRHESLKDTVAYWREGVFLRDAYLCQYCGTRLTLRTATVDHVVPESWGGAWAWENTVAACLPCNQAKADRLPANAEPNLKKYGFGGAAKGGWAQQRLMRQPAVPTVSALAECQLALGVAFPHESWEEYLLGGRKRAA